MKRKTLIILLSTSFILCYFIMCKKSGKENTPTQTNIEDPTVLKVNNWLQTQQMMADTSTKTTVSSLKKNLDFKNLYTEDYNNGETFIVVPVSKGFVSTNNKDKNPGTVLLLFVTDTGIRKGNIVQYYSNDPSITLPKGVFKDFFNSKDLSFSGTLSFLTIADSRKFDVTYKDNKMVSHSSAQTKSPPSNNGGRVEDCTDYYWVTYYGDGTEDWQYLFRNCSDDNCNQNRVAKNVTLKVGCGGNGGGGGAGDATEDCCVPDINMSVNSLPIYDPGTQSTISEITNSDGSMTKTKIYSWPFWNGSLFWYKWTRTSLETGTLTNASGKWKFVKLVHTGQQLEGTTPLCATVSFSMDATNTEYSYDRTRATMTLYFTESMTFNCMSKFPNSGSSSKSDQRFKPFDANQ